MGNNDFKVLQDQIKLLSEEQLPEVERRIEGIRNELVRIGKFDILKITESRLNQEMNDCCKTRDAIVEELKQYLAKRDELISEYLRCNVL